MNLHLLRTFAAVAQHGSFSAAAAAIHVSQPAVSRAVRELEEQLDAALIERGRGKLRLTEAGTSLYNHARAILALERAALADLRSRQKVEKGSLTVGASMTIVTYLLPSLVAEFLRLHPDVDVRIISGNTEAIERQLLEYELDLAFVEGPVSSNRVEQIPWREDELVVVAPTSHPLGERDYVDVCELRDQRWVVREEGSGTRVVAESLLRGAGVDLQRTLEVGSIEAVLESVVAGVGIAMVSLEAARHHLRLGRLNVLKLPTRFPRQLYRIRLSEKPVSAAAAEFIQLAQADSR